MAHRYELSDWQWERIFATLTADPDNDYLMLDSTLVRAHPQVATEKGGPGNIRLWAIRSFARQADHQNPPRRGFPGPAGPPPSPAVSGASA